MIIIIITDLKSVYSHCKQSRSAPVICAVTVPVEGGGGGAEHVREIRSNYEGITDI